MLTQVSDSKQGEGAGPVQERAERSAAAPAMPEGLRDIGINRVGPKHIADRDTPLIRDCWYVLAWSREVGRELKRRFVLERDVLFYRTRDGEAVALQNRCAHRSFPLHQGWLDGDHVVCGYHGLTYTPGGDCVRIPSDPNTRPRRIGIHRFPVKEVPPFVWIWTGDPEAADESLVPDHHWLNDPGWSFSSGTKHVGANYVALHENLLDLTHFSFLHAGNVGTLDYAEAPFTIEAEGDRVNIKRTLPSQALPALYDRPANLVGVRVDRTSDSDFVTPGWHAAHASFHDPAGTNGGRTRYRAEILHALTPETQYTTHYFWALARDFAQGDEGATSYIAEAIETAFEEDKDALEWIDHIQRTERRSGYHEVSVPADKASLRMRRILQRMADREASAVPAV